MKFTTLLAATAIVMAPVAGAMAQDAPFTVAPDLFDLSDPDTLGLPLLDGAETITVFAPGDDDWTFHHGVVLMPFADRLYAMWQTSMKDEDATETIVVYSHSADGREWSKPVALTAPWNGGYRSSGGWWTDGTHLVAYLNTWPTDVEPRGGHVEFMQSTDGLTWTAPQPVTMADGQPLTGIFEQDPQALPSGRIISAAHMQPGLTAKPVFTDDPTGVSGWTVAQMENMPHDGHVTRELEPSWFRRADGALVMIFRDQGDSLRKLASISTDDGESWTTPVLTDMPDGRVKQSAGNLADGTAFMVGNPVNLRQRWPLAITTSPDGQAFGTAWLLRDKDDLQPLRYEGKYKNPGYSYTKSVQWGDHLYVAYATNKEDVQITRMPLAALMQDAAP